MKGISGKILYVDLTEGKTEVKSLQDEVYENYLGGEGLGARLLFDEIGAGVDALSEQSPIIINPGLLVGSGLPTASKTSVVFKSPLTGAFGRSISGAYLGVALKKAGYDGIVIKGKSSKPVFLYIEDDKVEIRDAGALWGLDAIETQEKIKETLGSDFRTAAIGYSGEKLSFISGIDFEERQSARAGAGAVMGSKMLKAIAVKGTKNVNYGDSDRLKEAIATWNKKIIGTDVAKLDMAYGSGEFYEWVNKEIGVFPVKNWQESMFEESFKAHEDGKSHLDPYYWSPIYTEK
ncbi:MAG: aldehyde ferredoxin oxidoreductase N-terminal domain-containing protein, partial [Caldisericaceae bacterium]